MVQKEVAQKFTAKVNDKEYSSLGIITELISKESKILFDVPPESAFDPMPKVTSSVLYIKKDLWIKIDKDFNKFLKACFVQPRKKLSKNLSSVLRKIHFSSL
jgi:16S rRNA (adenine1518-N6/adenine1519-N6)-dimethyltransferase